MLNEDLTLTEDTKVRWMVNFWHPDGDRTTEPDFPKVDFWHPTKRTAQTAAARVLLDLKARGDTREWVAAGYPDPFVVNRVSDFCPVWLLIYEDIETDENGAIRVKLPFESALWIDGFDMIKRDIWERRLASLATDE